MAETRQLEGIVERRERLALAGQLDGLGEFEILAITAGEGNGWHFPEAVLKDSLNLWEGAQCFVDHGEWRSAAGGGKRSVRDLGGVVYAPTWDAARRGVVVRLRIAGPSGALVEAVGRELLAMDGPRPRLGFSADVLFHARGREVTKILRVLSLDLVFDPARGGAFLRAIQSIQDGGLITMNEKQTNLPETPTSTPQGGAAEAEREATVRAQAAQAQMCRYLLDSGLAASKLPQAMQAHVRRQFQNRSFEPGELEAAIDEARKLVSDLTAPATVQGANLRLQGMWSSADQLQAAADDLLGAPRDRHSHELHVSRLSGIKELYIMLTGDRNLYGGYYSDRVTLATTVDFAGLVKNALNKIVAEQWAELGIVGYDWWMKVTLQEHFDTLNQVTGILVGTVGLLPVVNEGAAYTELAVGDSPEATNFVKYGGYIPLTLELIDRDDTRKLRQYPRELAKAGMRRISSLVAGVFTTNGGAGPVMADTGNLFNATAVTTPGGHANLTTAALNATNWEVVKQAIYKQPMLIKNAGGFYGAGPAMAVNPRYLLVPKDLELAAMKVLYGEYDATASVIGSNLQRQRLGDVVVVPEWTDVNDWAAAVDPRLVPGIIVGERFGLLPEIFIAGDEQSPAVFTNDEHRLKVRHFVAVLVQDFRPLHKANVA